LASNTIKVSVLGDVKDINRKLGSVEKQLGGFNKKISGAAKLLTGLFVGGKAVGFFKDIVSGASDAQQSLGATETVFGKWSDTVIATSQKAADTYGLSANEYRENANLIASLLKNQGVSQDKLAGSSENLIAKAADLSATFGGPTKGAVEALSSALKGEFDPLEKYGISLKQSTVNAEAMRLANVKSVKDWNKLSDAQKKAYTSQATMNLINEQSADSQGAFAKETNTLAHQQQVLAAKIQNLKDKLGAVFLPILTKVAAFVSDRVLPKLEEFGKWFGEKIAPKIAEFGKAFAEKAIPAVKDFVEKLKDLGTWIKNNADWLIPLTVAITAFVATIRTAMFIRDVVAAIKAFSLASKVATVQQWLLNTAMLANPLVWIIALIVAAVAAVIYLWKTNEGFRDAVTGVWNAIKDGVGAVVEWFKTAIPAAWEWVTEKTSAFWEWIKTSAKATWDWIKNVTSTVWNGIKAFFSAVWNGIKIVITTYLNTYKTIIKTAWNVIKTTTSTVWNAIKAFFSTLWNAIKSIITSALNTYKSVITTAWNAIKSATTATWNAVKAYIEKVWNGLKSTVKTAVNAVVTTVKGIKDKITGIFTNAGSWLLGAGRKILDGLLGGIDEGIRKVKDKLQSVTKLIPDWKGPADKDKVLLRDAGRLIMDGLINGIDDKTGALKNQLKSVTRIISGTDVGSLQAGGLSMSMAGAGGYGSVVHVTVNVPPTADKAAIGREIKSALDEWTRVNGR